MGAGFEEEAEDVALGEGGEDGGEAEAAGVAGDLRTSMPSEPRAVALEFDAAEPQKMRRSDAEEEEFSGCGRCCGTDELRVEWDAEVGVEDDAEEGAAAGEFGAVGEGWVVGEDGADAGEDGVGGVAEVAGPRGGRRGR